MTITHEPVNPFAGVPPPAMPPGVVNLALGKPAYSSSSEYWSPASNAVDGQESAFESDYNSYNRDVFPWLAIDLVTPSLISQVVLYVNSLGGGLYNAQIRISNYSIASTNNGTSGISGGLLIWTLQGTAQNSGPIIRIKLSSPVVGKWVTLQNFHPGESGVVRIP